MKHARTLALLLAATAAGCTVGPDYHAPDMTVPAQYRDAGSAPYSVPVAGAADLSAWWKGFGDAELESLVTRALAANLDLKTAASRVREARQQEIIAGAAGLPQVNASGLGAHLHSNSSIMEKLGSAGGGASTSGTAGAAQPSSTDLSLYSLGFDASWEVDIFGGVRRSVEAAQANSDAALWQMRDGEVTLTAEIAADYVSLRQAQARLAILRAQLNSENGVIDLVAARARTGFVTELDVNQQRSLADTTAAEIPTLEAQAVTLEHAIAILLAVQPDTLAAELETSAPLPPLPATLPVGLPSDLLRRRPDVRTAERNLAAATAQIGVAVADLYPKFDLLGGASLSSNSLSTLLNSSSFGAFGLGSILWPIFTAGKTEANIHGREEERNQAYYAYQKAVLGAVKDVEDALVRYVSDLQRLQSLAHADLTAHTSTQLALQQYRAGLTPFINVLQAQTNAQSASDQLAQGTATLSADLVSLYKALGGGWSENAGLIEQAKEKK